MSVGRCFVHVDAKSDLSAFRIEDPRLSYVQDRVDVRWGAISQVDATLRLMRAALAGCEVSQVSHFVLLSGNCYPVRPLEEFGAYSRSHAGMNFIKMIPLASTRKLHERIRHFWFYEDLPVDGRKFTLVRLARGLSQLAGKLGRRLGLEHMAEPRRLGPEIALLQRRDDVRSRNRARRKNRFAWQCEQGSQPRNGAREGLLSCDEFVDEANGECLVRVDQFAGREQHAGTMLAYYAFHQVLDARRRDQANLRFIQAKAERPRGIFRLRHHPIVAAQCKNAAAGRCVSSDRRNDRHGRSSEHTRGVEERTPCSTEGLAVIAQR